jgi:hypothetical protein
MNAVTQQSAEAMQAAERAFRELSIASAEQLNNVTMAIRKCPLDCDVIAQIFDTLAAQMKVYGFNDVDLAAIDEARGWICGEQA